MSYGHVCPKFPYAASDKVNIFLLILCGRNSDYGLISLIFKKCREWLPDDCSLSFDANRGYSVPTAIEQGRRFEDLGIAWFEEPLSPEDLPGLKQVVDALDCAVSSGEGESSPWGFRNLIQLGNPDILQPDVLMAGGLSGMITVFELATAYNKILKDFIVKFHQMNGEDSVYVPGWDCHGLPIEWKIEEEYRKKGKNKDDVPIVQFRKECREFAEKWIDIQKKEFRRLGVEGDWADPYLTMSNKAEAQIVRELGKFLIDGLHI